MNNETCGKIMKNVRKHRDIYKSCSNSKKKKLFGVRTKLSYYKVFHRKLISNRNEKNRDTYE